MAADKPKKNTAAPKGAAAVVLVRRPEDPEVYWVKRNRRVSYMPGFHAFPGGRVDAEDDSFRQAAVRELAEETSVEVDAKELKRAGHWITPPFMPKRFDTRFYLAWVADDQEARADASELEHGEWIRPADALEKWRRGEAIMAPPILHILRVLAEHPTDEWETALVDDPQAQGGRVRNIEFRPGIRLVPLMTLTLPPATHTNCYIVGGKELVVVDPGATDDEQEVLHEQLDPLLADGARLKAILVTHHHIDHVAGANDLRERTKAPVWAHRHTAEVLSDSVRLDRLLSDGDRILLSGSPVPELLTLHTPGHARGHLCFIDPRGQSVFTGDLIVGFGTVVVDPPDGSMSAYMASLARLMGRDIDVLFPGHGPVMGAGERVVRRYIRHRQAREEKVIEALRGGNGTLEAILPLAYDDVPSALQPYAQRSLVAILQKLGSEGRATESEGQWSLP